MRIIHIPLNEKQYTEAIKTIEDFNPDIVILDMGVEMTLLKQLDIHFPIGKGAIQDVINLLNKIDTYVMKKFETCHLYVPDFSSNDVTEGSQHHYIIQKMREDIFSFLDLLLVFGIVFKFLFYSVLNINKRTKNEKRFETMLENTKFKSARFKGSRLAYEYKRMYKINEIRKIASTHQREKILYIGIETDLSEIVNLKARFN